MPVFPFLLAFELALELELVGMELAGLVLGLEAVYVVAPSLATFPVLGSVQY